MLKRLSFQYSTILIFLLILLIPQSCTFQRRGYFAGPDDMGGLLLDIKNRGKLIALTDNNPFNYFTLRGEERGYQYEMLKSFASYLGVELELIVEPDPHKALLCLKQREVDLIAMELPLTAVSRSNVVSTKPLFTSRQVLVQRKPDNWRRMPTMRRVETGLIRDIAGLSGKTIVLPAGKYKQFYLSDIQHATGYSTDITGIEKTTTTDLIEAVALKEAGYTIAFEHTARAMAQIYHDLDVSTPVSPDLDISWTVRKGAVNLLVTINQWIEERSGSREFAYTYSKYYKNARQARLALGHSVKRHSISEYDDLLRESSRIINWDWRLVAALIYKESKFQMDAVSHRGAFGLMQLMPHTAKRFGADENSTAAEQVTAGLKLIKYLDKAFSKKVPDPEERKKFILAAYNIGIAHIYDAQNLAEKHGKNPAVWYDNVEFFLLAKSQPEFYNDPVVKYGKVKGIETKQFVRDVLEKYDHYKTMAAL